MPLNSAQIISPSSNSIFPQPLINPEETRKKEKIKNERNKKKGQILLGVSFIILVTYSVFFFYGQASAYLKATSQIETLEKETAQYKKDILPTLEASKNMHKAAFDEISIQTMEALNTVFPPALDKLGMVQLLETFASEMALISPPFEFSSINFGKIKAKGDYQIIPLSMVIHSSQSGFDQFLGLVQNSGHIYEDFTAEDKVIREGIVRLMSISDISIKNRGIDPKTGKDDGMDFTVELNVYSRI